MTFASRQTRCPIAFDASAAAETSVLFADLSPPLRELLAGTAGCSPYLRGSMLHEADWLRMALADEPETALNALMLAVRGAPVDMLGPALRRTKRRLALLVALADLAGVWPLERVTGSLTDFADLAVDLGVKALVADEIRRGKLPGMKAEQAATGAGMFVLAMGKMGAGELNYSSDIDLICLFDDDLYRGVEAEARTAFVRVTRRLTALLSDQTADGYVFRTDLRLRPDAAVTAVCLSASAAESYYESVGRTWERAAYIKARTCAGDIAAGEAFLRVLRPFVWRKHLDFAAIQDAHDIRLRIRDHRRLHGPISLPGHNMKLGVGGIREIEFFTQTHQIIAGGRDESLRLRQTLPALGALADKGWVPGEVAAELVQHYRHFREVEHRLQMMNDAQTHDLPGTTGGMDRLARLMGQGDTDTITRDLQSRLVATSRLTDGFFTPRAPAAGPEISAPSRALVEGWRNYPALRSTRAVEIFRRVQPKLLSRLDKAANPEAALLQFDAFLKGLPAGVQVFSLFDVNPQLIDLMVDIASTAPHLALHLSRNAGVLDAVIGGSFFAPWPGIAGLQGTLGAVAAAVADYEGKLVALRRVVKEWHFRIGVHHLRGLIGGWEASSQYAELAEAAVATVWPVCLTEFARKHGAPPGNGAAVLAMGSMGARRLNAQSDLDLILIYDPADAEMSEGSKPLATRSYYARLVQALVNALSAPMAEGKLYEVDMRLRPSGKQGPVASTFAAFCDYQRTEAWTWEHLAMTRARPIAGDARLQAAIETFRIGLLVEKGGTARIIGDVKAMRAKLLVSKPAGGPWDVKPVAGGLMDIELIAETAALMAHDPSRTVAAQVQAGVTLRWLTVAQSQHLTACHDLCWRLHMVARLLGGPGLSAALAGTAAVKFVLHETGDADMMALETRLSALCRTADRIVTHLLQDEPAAIGG